MTIEPNRWRVLTVVPDEGEAPSAFYVFRNPPMAAFETDSNGNRRKYGSFQIAEIVADRLNREGAQ
jgi:hypothetical protein